MAARKAAKKALATRRATKDAAAGADRKHTVKASLRNVDLTKATSALNLVLRADGEKLGELVVGRGSFFWYARNSKKRQRITWSDFADLMSKNAE
jgi:hypothetical protein